MSDSLRSDGYRGRFAPTPSGPLHLGSLSTALASWLVARRAGGRWLLRVDDLDTPRCQPGAQDHIYRQLEAHGLLWDEAPLLQSRHLPRYHDALDTLGKQGRLYHCDCTRAQLVLSSRPGPDGPLYPGTCRQRGLQGCASALRFALRESDIVWHDGFCGTVSRRYPATTGDFVVMRADGQIGYHLACALDEQFMGISEVVRGADLLGATTSQISVMDALGHAPPRYAHVPLLVAADGRKLSKQNGAPPIATDPLRVTRQLWQCLQQLRQNPPAALQNGHRDDLLRWAGENWNSERLQSPTKLSA